MPLPKDDLTPEFLARRGREALPEFLDAGPLNIRRSADGAPVRFPTPELSRAHQVRHAWGDGPFCEFTPPYVSDAPGLYAFTAEGRVLFIAASTGIRGSLRNFDHIPPGRCAGAEAEWCRLNRLILGLSELGVEIHLAVHQVWGYEAAKKRLITEKNPPWNVEQPRGRRPS